MPFADAVCMRLRHQLRFVQLAVLIAYLALNPQANGQLRSAPTTGGGGSIRGAVLQPNGSFVNERVKISLQSVRGTKSSVYTDDRGQFQFTSLSAGAYQVVAEADGGKYQATTVNVEVYPGGPSVISIVLREKGADSRTKGSAVVSATELDAAIPDKARKEFDRANEAARTGRTDEAIIHLRKAIEIYPQYLMALNDLGVSLLSQGKLDEAADPLNKAVALEPKAFNPRLNLGIVLVQQHKFPAAVENLRKAVALESSAPAARLYLGIALEGTGELEEAQRELKVAHDSGGPKFSLALFHLGQIHMTRGENAEARKVFHAYLQESPNAYNSDEVRRLIRLLQ
jgi:tetratricopeptide (TPR) repeat protein